MPINASPEYFKAEKKFSEATTTQGKIAALEEMLRTAPSHKSSENLRANIKERLAKYRELLEKARTQAKGKGAAPGIKREGAAQVMIVSVTNAGKSSLLAAVTNARPQIADYPYTTTKPEIGIMEYEGVNIQLVELPAVYEDYAYKGDGPGFLSIIRGSDLVVFLIDTTQDEKKQLALLYGEFEKAQIKLNVERPKVSIERQGLGGIEYLGKKYMKFDLKDATKLLTQHGYHNATVSADAPITIEDLADVLNESIVYLPLVVVYTKADVTGKGISMVSGKGLPQLRHEIFKALKLIRVYTKTPGKPKDWPPVALHEGETVKDLATIIHKDFYKKFKFARIWGKSVKHDGTTVGLEHKFADGDVVEFHVT